SGGGKTSNTATATVGNVAPTIVTPASATLNASKTSASLSVLATGPDPSRLVYSWTLVSESQGAGPVVFGANGTNAARNTTVTFSTSGGYLFKATVTDPVTGLTTSSSVTVFVDQVLNSLTLLPGTVTVAAGASQLFTPWARDQFGNNVNPAAVG